MTADAFRDYSMHLQPSKTLLLMLVHTAATTDVLSQFTIDDLFSDLPGNSAEYTEFSRLSTEFYRQEFGCELDTGTVTALIFIEGVVVPFLQEGFTRGQDASVELASTIKKQVTHVGNGRGVRIHLVLNKWRPAASWSMRVGGGNVDVASASADYFDDRHKRNATMVAFFLLLLANEIETKSVGLFDKQGGFAVEYLS